MPNPWSAIPLIVLFAAAIGSAARAVVWANAPEAVTGAASVVATSAADDPAAWVLEPHNPPPIVVPPSRDRRPLVGGVTVAVRNRNPLNIKLGRLTRHHVDTDRATISRIAPLDGGQFLTFESPTTGFRAAIELLTGPAYRELSLDRMLRRWSNDGAGAEILSGDGLDARTLVGQLDEVDIARLLRAMALAEGYRSASMQQEIAEAVALSGLAQPLWRH